jgi:hypothetical protein
MSSMPVFLPSAIVLELEAWSHREVQVSPFGWDDEP